MMTAIKFGEKHSSCPEAMEQRRALGPDATQADWWRVCPWGDWLIWQLQQVGLSNNNPALDRAIDKIIARAIRRGQKALRGIRMEWATAWRRWARCWLSGDDRTPEAAANAVVAAAYAAADAANASANAAYAAYAAARQAEWQLQARDIRREIPEWPGDMR